MNDYNVSDYSIFDEAISSTNTFKSDLDTINDVVVDAKTRLSDQSIFMGPAQEMCINAFSHLDTSFEVLTTNLMTMSKYLTSTSDAYKSGDESASNVILSIDDSGKVYERTGSGLTGNTNSDKIWNYLIDKGFSPAGAAGIMGNLERESGFISGNVQNGMGYSDEEYVNGIKNGTITREQFINDSRGFGIAQWTYSTRKAALYDALGPENIDNLEMQLDFMCNEMSSDLKNTMMNATDPGSAAQTFHNVYEKSASKNTTNRQNSANNIYNQYV